MSTQSLYHFIFTSTYPNAFHVEIEELDNTPDDPYPGYFHTYGARAAQALGANGIKDSRLRVVTCDDWNPLYHLTALALQEHLTAREGNRHSLHDLIEDFREISYHSAFFRFCDIPVFYDNGNAEPAGGAETFWFFVE